MIIIITEDYSNLSDYAYILVHQTARVVFAAKSSKPDDSELNKNLSLAGAGFKQCSYIYI